MAPPPQFLISLSRTSTTGSASDANIQRNRFYSTTDVWQQHRNEKMSAEGEEAERTVVDFKKHLLTHRCGSILDFWSLTKSRAPLSVSCEENRPHQSSKVVSPSGGRNMLPTPSWCNIPADQEVEVSNAKTSEPHKDITHAVAYFVAEDVEPLSVVKKKSLASESFLTQLNLEMISLTVSTITLSFQNSLACFICRLIFTWINPYHGWSVDA